MDAEREDHYNKNLLECRPLEAALLKMMKRERLTPARALKTLYLEMMQMKHELLFKEQFLMPPPPKKNRKWGGFFFHSLEITTKP